MSIKTIFAIIAAKKVSFLIRTLGLGDASSAPGMIALKIDPNIISKLGSQCKENRILITATNGKTTTTKLIAGIFKSKKINIVCNDVGANLASGIATAFMKKANIFGRIKCSTAVIEVDEAVLPFAVNQLNPNIVLIGNLFRDQLDRYGEIDTILAKWIDCLKNTDGGLRLILNADDPGINYLGQIANKRTYWYGLEKEESGLKQEKLEHASDSVRCFNCGQNLIYKQEHFSHLGDFYCQNCGFKRSKLDYIAKNIRLNSQSTLLQIKDEWIEDLEVNLPGIYNVYNILAAWAVGKITGFTNKEIKAAFADFKPAFGRMEDFTYKGAKAKLMLVKNPAGANAVLNVLKKVNNKELIILLNDKIADGTDVSWIWDVDFENIGEVKKITCLGTRKYDLALRLKYAGIDVQKINIAGSEYWSEIQKIMSQSKDEIVYILPTYTALMELYKSLEKEGLVSKQGDKI